MPGIREAAELVLVKAGLASDYDIDRSLLHESDIEEIFEQVLEDLQSLTMVNKYLLATNNEKYDLINVFITALINLEEVVDRQHLSGDDRIMRTGEWDGAVQASGNLVASFANRIYGKK